MLMAITQFLPQLHLLVAVVVERSEQLRVPVAVQAAVAAQVEQVDQERQIKVLQVEQAQATLAVAVVELVS